MSPLYFVPKINPPQNIPRLDAIFKIIHVYFIKKNKLLIKAMIKENLANCVVSLCLVIVHLRDNTILNIDMSKQCRSPRLVWCVDLWRSCVSCDL